MKCPVCGFLESKVVDSRPMEESEKIKRRRECLSCQKRFSTYEIIETVPILVVKRDGTIRAFDRAKLLNSMLRACEKRKVSLSLLERAAKDIEMSIQNSLEREIETSRIGALAMAKLKDIDAPAYVRFASVYRQFKDVDTFLAELKKMSEQ